MTVSTGNGGKSTKERMRAGGGPPPDSPNEDYVNDPEELPHPTPPVRISILIYADDSAPESMQHSI